MIRQMVLRRSVALVVLVTTAFTLGACGNKGSTNGDTTGTGENGTPAAASGSDVTIAPDGPPHAGGSVVFALASETDGFDPTQNRWAADGTQEALAIFDPLAAYDSNGIAQPYLAKSFEHNSDFTEWTVTVRSGVQFQDGSAFDANAVKQALDKHIASPLTHPQLSLISSIEVTDPTRLVFKMKGPWASFPANLTGQVGLIPAPSMFTNPDASRHPVGTGPFRFVEWVPDNKLVLERNGSYWQKDAEGNPLPYLDRVEFRPIPDDLVRANAIATGEVDMASSTTISTILQWKDLAAAGKIQLVQQRGQSEVAFVMLNQAKPPFDNAIARSALAHATDRSAYEATVDQGASQVATTLFKPGSKWYSDVPFPGYDLETAKNEVQEYKAATGQPLAFNFAVLGSPAGRRQAEFLKQMWEQAGMQVSVSEAAASTYILDAVMGNFQAVMWGQFGSPDPDYEHVWWYSANAAPVGSLSLNFPRHSDPQTDQALDDARATDDFATRKAAYARVQERFAADLPYIWIAFTVPSIAAQNDVRGITNGPLPDGQPSMPMGGPGSFSITTRLTQTWKTS